MEGLVLALQRWFTRFTGWKSIVVTIDAGVLTVKCEVGCLLKYDFRNNREVYGRVRHLGMILEDLESLRRVV